MREEHALRVIAVIRVGRNCVRAMQHSEHPGQRGLFHQGTVCFIAVLRVTAWKPVCSTSASLAAASHLRLAFTSPVVGALLAAPDITVPRNVRISLRREKFALDYFGLH